MSLKLRELVLEIIAEGDGRIQGKTLIQKKAYFVGVELQRDLGHQAHFYGPYSHAVEYALGELRGLGFVEEHLVGFGETGDAGFEVKRYDYVLTEDGKRAVQRLRERESQDYGNVKRVLDEIKEAGNPDYLILSVAAKVMYILRKRSDEKGLSKDDIRNEAERLDWKLRGDDVKDATEFLAKMGLVACEGE